jgi:spore germination protein KC
MPRLNTICCLLVMTLSLTGCWSRIEINDRLFVAIVFVDAGETEEEISMTLGFPLSGRLSAIQRTSSGDGNMYTNITRKATSLAAAYRKIQTDVSRQINWGHTRIIVVGDKMARRGLRPILDFVSQQPTFQIKANLFVTTGEAFQFSKTVSNIERFPAEILREMAVQHAITDTTVKDLMMGGPYLEDGLVGRIGFRSESMISEKGKIGQRLRNVGAAMIKNGKLVDYFDIQDMRSAMWIKGKMENAVISIESPADGKIIDFMVVASEAKIKVKPNGDRVTFQIEIIAQDDVLASNSTIDLQEPAQMRELTDMLSRKLTERIKHAIEKSQRVGVDVFGFGQYLDWYQPAYWSRWKKNWHQHYSEDTDFVVKAEVEIKRLGAVRNPYWKPVELLEKRSEGD